MRINPEDIGKAQIRAELRTKPISTAQLTHLKKSFISNATAGKVELAHTALHLIPKDEQDKLDKSDYFRNLIEQGRTDIIDETLKYGTHKDQQQLHTESLKIEEKERIDQILTSISKVKPKQESSLQSGHLFSSMKNKLNTMLGRSTPIAPEQHDFSDERTNSISSDSDSVLHDKDSAADDDIQDQTGFENRI
jgi:hypothetical protein|tara:strand:+ start:36987 stop:37565 length:579 start_codon:yes stop_codon:yes gene_type:complete